jgi:hypothetical protein
LRSPPTGNLTFMVRFSYVKHHYLKVTFAISLKRCSNQ